MFFGLTKKKVENMNVLNNIKRIVEDGTLSDTLSMLAKLTSLLNPALGGGLMLASNITDNFNAISDDTLQNDVIGLSGCASRLQKMIDTKNVDFDSLEMIVKNLKSIAEYTHKSAKLIS